MAIKLQIRRGLKQDLPVLAAGEFGLCEDTGELFIGTTGGNLPVLLPDGSGDMLKSVYDTDNDGVVDKAESVPWAGVTDKPAAFPPGEHTHSKSQITDMPTSLPADGGNSDTVDGKHASEFATAAQGAKADGALQRTGGTISGMHIAANDTETADIVFDRPNNYEYEVHMDLLHNYIRFYGYDKAGTYKEPFQLDFDTGVINGTINNINIDGVSSYITYNNNTGWVYVSRNNTIMPYFKANRADNDADGSAIKSTYLASVDHSGNLIRFKNKNGSVLYTVTPPYAATALKASNSWFDFGDCQITNTASQKLKIFASRSEVDYSAFLGVAEGRWTFCPDINNNFRLGSPNYRWDQVFSSTAAISTSDAARKTDIQALDAATALGFLTALEPVSYKMLDGSSGRTHWGLIAQDVWQAMEQVGLSEMDFAGYCRDAEMERVQIIRQVPVTDPDDGDLLGTEEVLEEEEIPAKTEDGEPKYIYGLRYEEFIPLALLGAQEALRRADAAEAERRELRAQNEALQNALAALAARVAALEAKGA